MPFFCRSLAASLVRAPIARAAGNIPIRVTQLSRSGIILFALAALAVLFLLWVLWRFWNESR